MKTANITKQVNPWDDLKIALECRDMIIEDGPKIKAFQKKASKRIEILEKELQQELSKVLENDFYADAVEEIGLQSIALGDFYDKLKEDWNQYLKGIIKSIQ